MQPILMLAVVGVAAVALGTGFLNNNIELWIQEFGVGAGDIQTPVDHITVDFNIKQIEDPDNAGEYLNVIDKCIFTLDSAVGDPAIDVKQSELTCKVTGKDADWLPSGDILAEGTLCGDSFDANTPYMIPLGVATDCRDAVILDGTPTEVNVMEVGDVIVVAHGDTYSPGDHTPGGSSPFCEPGFIVDPLTNACIPDLS